MKAKNRGYFRSGVGEVKFRQRIGFFSMEFTATDAAKLTKIALRSANTIFIKLRKKPLRNAQKYLLLIASLNWINLTWARRRNSAWIISMIISWVCLNCSGKTLFSFLSLIENIRPLAEGSCLTISGFDISLRIKAYRQLNFDSRKRSIKLKKVFRLA